MLIVTEPKYLYPNLQFLSKNSFIVNIDANVGGFYHLNLMPDIKQLGNMDPYSQEFDMWYTSQILNNETLFMNFMQIVSALRDGRDVVLLMYTGSDIINAMNEVLVKMIQVRYGYNYQVVDCADGIDYYDQSGFTTLGILQVDEDYNRYRSLLAKYNMININAIIGETHL